MATKKEVEAFIENKTGEMFHVVIDGGMFNIQVLSSDYLLRAEDNCVVHVFRCYAMPYDTIFLDRKKAVLFLVGKGFEYINMMVKYMRDTIANNVDNSYWGFVSASGHPYVSSMSNHFADMESALASVHKYSKEIGYNVQGDSDKW
jgi:hypothetical protein